MRRPQVVTTRTELAAALSSPVPSPPVPPAPGAPVPGDPCRPERRRRAVVMTMGALHEGHLSLVRTAREHAEQVVVTVFVNPLQFGAGEDLDRYPRNLDRDVGLLAGAGADLVFAPGVEQVYPDGEPLVRVAAGPIGDVLEGAQRPGHFDGVLTVVLKLLHLTAPDVAVFGRKDAQQLVAIRRMVRDLDLDVRIVAGDIVRDVDGVALSSRNAYLDPEQRVRARALSLALGAAQQTAARGAGPVAVRQAAVDVLEAQDGLVVDYVALADPGTLQDVGPHDRGEALLLVAARVGTTRLIDNVTVRLEGTR